MRKQSKWNRVIAVVLTASLFIPKMSADVFAYSSANIVKEENELQMDMDLDSKEETEPEVIEKITITSQPTDVTVYSGKSFTFTVSADGTGLTYLWQTSSDNGVTWTNTTCTKNSYTGTASDNMTGNQFRCVVTDGSENTVISAAATLTVNKKVTITSQLKDVIAYSGQTFTMSLTAEGTDLTYMWQLSIDGGTTWYDFDLNENSVSETAFDVISGCLFRCVVTDGDGNKVTSRTAKLTVMSGTAISSQPKDVTVYSGKLFTFAVSAEGKELSYLWQYSTDGGTTWNSTNCTDDTYTGIAVANMNGHMFRCIVTDGDGNKLTSSTARLTVNKTVSITTQPIDVTVYSGKSFTFTVAADGTDLTYQWQSSSDNGITWSNTTCTKSSYTGTASDAMNGNMFGCVVTDGDGNKVTSSAATLTVNKTVTISTQPVDATVYSGKSFNFAVTAEGTDLSYQWQSSTDNGATWNNTSCTKSSYTGTAADAMNGNLFRCVVTDGGGNKVTTSAATLTVNKTVTISSQPVNATVYSGKDFTFTVTANGADLTYIWQSSTDNGTTWSNTTCTKSSYTGTASDAMNGNMFRCVVTDGDGNKVTSSAAKLTVNKTVIITTQPTDVTVYSGKSYTFAVTAEGTDLTYIWQSSTDNGSTWNNTTCTKSSYTGTASNDMNGNQFRCIVTDGAGNKVTSNAATLTVKQKAAFVVQPKDTTVSDGQIFTFSVTAVGTNLTYMWQFSLDGKTWYDASINSDSVFDMAFTIISGCQFRCVVTDGDGNTAVSDIATLTVK